MRKLVAVLSRTSAVVLWTGACASSAATPARTPEVVVATAPTRLIEHTADAGVATRIDAPAADVYAALRKAYFALGIPITSDDASAVRLGNPQFVLRRQFAGEQLSNYFNCGSGLTGAIANSARIYVSLQSTVTPVDGGSTVRTSVSAVGIDPEREADRLNCGSSGRLESRIAEQTKRILGR